MTLADKIDVILLENFETVYGHERAAAVPELLALFESEKAELQRRLDEYVAMAERVSDADDAIVAGGAAALASLEAERDSLRTELAEVKEYWDCALQAGTKTVNESNDEILSLRTRAETAEAELKEAHKTIDALDDEATGLKEWAERVTVERDAALATIEAVQTMLAALDAGRATIELGNGEVLIRAIDDAVNWIAHDGTGPGILAALVEAHRAATRAGG